MLREPARNGCVALAAFERQTASYNVPSVRMD
jgi:hypothetical protein